MAKNISHLNVRYGVIHGGVADDERYNLRHRFALPKDNPDALDLILSSEVGCEGLDFQFCDMLVNYDLPWNPMRIEQRIGRIDRYGQKSETVAIVNFITPIRLMVIFTSDAYGVSVFFNMPLVVMKKFSAKSRRSCTILPRVSI
ncbi:MAG: SWF/SNF helicase family protein [Moraxellaceae bacterium]|nr:SWF/SNF helicase family protein [Moraxellaceae bacterium]